MSEPEDYEQFTPRQNRDRDINELEGLIRGIDIDGRILPAEAMALNQWCIRPRNWDDRDLFRTVRDRVRDALADGSLDDSDRADLFDLLDDARNPNSRYSIAAADMQRLHGILAGIGADGIVSRAELEGLRAWMVYAENLKGSWPYDEVDGVLTHVLGDGRIDEEEHRFLVEFTQAFLRSRLDELPDSHGIVRGGICATDPDVSFPGKMFCVTGASPFASRREIERIIAALGGTPHPRVVKDLDYLLVAAERSLHWAFSCYGRKVEAAMKLRRNGAQIVIVEENDFWDAAEDAGHPRPRAEVDRKPLVRVGPAR